VLSFFGRYWWAWLLAGCLNFPHGLLAQSPAVDLAKRAIALYEAQPRPALELAQQAWQQAQANNDATGQAWALLALGEINFHKGSLDSAYQQSWQAHQRFAQLGQRQPAAIALRNAGATQAMAGSFTSAGQLLSQALAQLKTTAPNSRHLAQAYREMGICYLRQQLFKQSLSYLDTARQRYQALGDRNGEARSLNNQGLAYKNMGDYQQALTAYLESVQLYDRADQPSRQQAAALINLAIFYQTAGDTSSQQLDSLYNRAFEVARSLNDTLQVVGMAYSLVNHLMTKKRYQAAIEHVKEAKTLAQQAGLLIEEANLTTQMGYLFSQTKPGQGEAVIELTRAIELYRLAQKPDQAIAPLNLLCAHYRASNQFEQALEYGRQALIIKQKPDLKYAEANLQHNLAYCYLGLGKIDSARQATLALMAEGRESNRRQNVLVAYWMMYRIDSTTGSLAGQINWLKQYKNLNDSLVTIEKTRVIQDQATRYTIGKLQQKNQLQAAKLQQRNLWLGLAGLLVASVIVVAGLLYRQLQQRRQTNKLLGRQNQELAAKNEALETLDREKTRLMGVITHDLRTPLGNIRTVADLQLEGDLPTSQDNLLMIRQIADDTLSTVNQLLSWQAANTVEITPKLETIDVLQVMRTVTERAAQEAAQKQIRLELQASQAAYLAHADQHFTRKIFENLISNAIKFSPNGKNVYLELTQTDGQTVATVRDEGPGIKPEDFPKLFGQFQQLSARPTAGEASSGLGLYIVKRYAESMGGAISCQSEPGQGATFTLRLLAA
jgi:signal transduction histidine kinase/tetratricopeptide (TPR) repeat protein